MIWQFKDPLPTLEELGIQQLYTPPATPIDGKHADRAFILKKIAKSLLLNFLELVGIMAQNPEQASFVSIPYRAMLTEYGYSMERKLKTFELCLSISTIY
jgi:hypothetical protein